jgi:hypothetical protein
VVYELWRDDSLNLSAAVETEREALAAVREEVARNGPAVVLRTVPVRADGRGNRTAVAEGQQLVDRALPAGAPKNRRARLADRPRARDARARAAAAATVGAAAGSCRPLDGGASARMARQNG